MKSSDNRRAVLADLLEFFEVEYRRKDLADPFWFVTKVLGYRLEDFHRAWWRFQEDNPRTLILAPRGHGKSTILTIAYSLWNLVRDRNLRILIVSNTQSQARAFLREIKRHLESNREFARFFGNLCGRPWSENDINLAGRKSMSKETSVTVMGMFGPIISRHYDLIILDDVIDEENASSSRRRERALTWYYKELLPCLEPHGAIHIIGTRYHYLDLYGHLLEREFEGCNIISRAIDTRGGKMRALWEEKFPLIFLLKKREEAGPVIFNSQYQNDVEAMKGKIFREEWIQYYKNLPAGLKKFQAVDLAISRSEHADYFAHVTIGRDEKNRIFLLNTFRGRLSFEGQFRKIKDLYNNHNTLNSPILRIGVESNAYQEAMAQKLRSDTYLPVKSINRLKDKITRAYRLQAHLENGRILFPLKGAENLIEEMLLFPEAPHDDLFDAFECAVSLAQAIGSYEETIKIIPDVSPEAF